MFKLWESWVEHQREGMRMGMYVGRIIPAGWEHLTDKERERLADTLSAVAADVLKKATAFKASEDIRLYIKPDTEIKSGGSGSDDTLADRIVREAIREAVSTGQSDPA